MRLFLYLWNMEGLGYVGNFDIYGIWKAGIGFLVNKELKNENTKGEMQH